MRRRDLAWIGLGGGVLFAYAMADIVVALQAGRPRVMQALQSNGFSVPNDFSVIGLDDIAVALHSRPPLTTIRIDRIELGRAGIQMLMKRIADPGANIVRVNIGERLVERATDRGRSAGVKLV